MTLQLGLRERRKGLVAATAFLATLGLGTEASAQSFTYAPLNGSRNIAITPNGFTDNNWVHDVFGDTSGTPGSFFPRYAPNLHHRLRVVGNPYVRDFFFIMDQFELNEVSTGGSADFLRTEWYDGTAATDNTGTKSAGSWLGVGASGTRSLMQPGARFTFSSGPSWSGSGTYSESEDSGFRASSVDFWGNGTMGNASPTVLTPHERVLGVVLANDDIVDMRLPATSTPATVALWLEGTAATGVSIWARCGGYPDATNFDHKANTGTSTFQSGAFLDLEACPSGWFLTVSNVSSANRVFHLLWGAHSTSRELSELKIGVGWNATASELATIRDRFQTASWQLWFATHGTLLLRSFRLYNNATGCHTWPNDDYACAGGGCNYCVVSSATACTSNYNGAKVTLCQNPNPYTSRTIVHEAGHAYLNLRDNYHYTSASCPAWNTLDDKRIWSLCSHSYMAQYQVGNRKSFCNDMAHRSGMEDWRGLSASNTWAPVSDGPIAYDCSGYALWTNWGFDWSALNNYAPMDLPSGWSATNADHSGFYDRSSLGRFLN